MIASIQLNHPGRQKKFSLKGGYFKDLSNKIIREWNKDKSHYRKFLINSGYYLDENSNECFSSEILFWGEWEGFSYFEPILSNSRLMPNGIHSPFHDNLHKGTQNTDPYIFNENFYYAICKQRGRLCSLNKGSLILFGSSFQDYFALDTVFVVNSFITAKEAFNNIQLYSTIYKEETLDQLIPLYYNSENDTNKLYTSLNWNENKDYFSFVPCKLKNDVNINGFERLKLPYKVIFDDVSFSNNPTVVKYLSQSIETNIKIWNYIVNEARIQNFNLGVKFMEPTIQNIS